MEKHIQVFNNTEFGEIRYNEKGKAKIGEIVRGENEI